MCKLSIKKLVFFILILFIFKAYAKNNDTEQNISEIINESNSKEDDKKTESASIVSTSAAPTPTNITKISVTTTTKIAEPTLTKVHPTQSNSTKKQIPQKTENSNSSNQNSNIPSSNAVSTEQKISTEQKLSTEQNVSTDNLVEANPKTSETVNSFPSSNESTKKNSSGNPDGTVTTSSSVSNTKSNVSKNSIIHSAITTSIVVGFCVVGFIAYSGYRVVKKRSVVKSSNSYSSSNKTPSFIDTNNPRTSLVNSLIYENEVQNENQYNDYAYYMEKNEPYSNEMENNYNGYTESTSPIEININDEPYQYNNNQTETTNNKRKSVISVKRSSITSKTALNRNSIVRHSFLNPNLKIVRTSNRTQQLYEATDNHPAIIETFPTLEREYEPVLPVPLEESDINSLHPYSIYQNYQEEMEYENYYAYTIDDKEYIIDPTTNRVLEIHDLTTDEYMLVEEELYLDFSGSSSEDSDSLKQEI